MDAQDSRLAPDTFARGFARASQYLANMLTSSDVLSEAEELVRGIFAADVVYLCQRASEPRAGRRQTEESLLPAVREVLESGLMAVERVDHPVLSSYAILPVTVKSRTEAALVVGYEGSAALPAHALEALLGVAGLIGAALARQRAACELLTLAEERAARANADRSRRELCELIERLPLGVFIDRAGTIVYANPTMASYLKYPAPADLVSREPAALLAPEQLPGAGAGDLREAWASHRSSDRVWHFMRHDGRPVTLEASAAREIDFDGQPAFLCVFRDVTEEHLRRKQLQESEERYRSLFQGAGEGILVADVETGALLYCNGTWCGMFGYEPEELSHLTLQNLHPSGAPEALRACATKKLLPDSLCLHKEGSVFTADIRTTTIWLDQRLCCVGFFTDTTERRAQEKRLEAEKALREKAEVELRHAQKLQAVGQLAAGVAHEINTPAQFIGDSLQFLADSFQEELKLVGEYRRALQELASAPGYEEVARRLSEAEGAGDQAYIEQNVPGALERALEGVNRVSTIVRAMKEFAHPDRCEKSPADLNHALKTTLVIARNEYKYVADVETELGDLPPVSCHLSDMNQVFLNLIVNAAHAISDVSKNGDRGRILVRTRQEGNVVRIEVSDTGCGIPESIRERVFEPFFTTKEVGRGSGQGLAIARSVVVDKHGGSLTFETEEGKGTTFTVLLPIDGKSALNPLFPSAETRRGRA